MRLRHDSLKVMNKIQLDKNDKKGVSKYSRP